MLLLKSCANTDQLREVCAKYPLAGQEGAKEKESNTKHKKQIALRIFHTIAVPIPPKKKNAFRNRSYFAVRQETQWHAQICQISDSAVLNPTGPACCWQGVIVSP